VSVDTAINLPDVVRRAKEEGEGNSNEAVALLMQWARADHLLYAAIMEPSLEGRCRSLVTRLNNTDREAAWRNGGGSLSRQTLNGQASEELERAAVLLSFGLPNGRPLGKASLVDLGDALTVYSKNERAYRRNRLFIEKVMPHVQRGQLVEDVLTDAAIRELMLEASEEAKGQ
jgi:hypothetical protein